jgi:hypothetical protein
VTGSKERPRSAADARPGGHPCYIGLNCPDCDTPLVLLDLLENPATPPDKVWYDEWTCSRCDNGIVFLDCPPEPTA